MTSPTQLSLKLLREEGYIVAIVEKYNIFSHRRIDLFSIGDLLAVKDNENGCTMIQTTSSSNLSARVHKSVYEKEPYNNLKIWLAAGNRFILHGWSKKGPKGKRKLWTVTKKEFTLKELIEKHEHISENSDVVLKEEIETSGGDSNECEEMVSVENIMGGDSLRACRGY